MDQSASAPLRWSRAALLGGLAMSAGTFAHVQAAGLLPGVPALLLILALCVVGAAVFLGRPASRLRVVLLLVGGQTFVHGTLTALSGHRGDPPLTRAPRPAPVPVAAAQSLPTQPGTGRRTGSLMDQFQAVHPADRHVQMTVPYPIQHLVADMTGPHALMALAHLCAAVVVGLWLARGERALWTLLAHTAALSDRLLTPALTGWAAAIAAFQYVAGASKALARYATGSDLVVIPTGQVLARSRPRRGPPAAAVA